MDVATDTAKSEEHNDSPPIAPAKQKQTAGVGRFATALTVLISGSGIGILVGLSVAPVVGTVVSTLVALAAGLLTVSKNLRITWPAADRPQHYSFSLDSPVQLEIAFFVVGLVAGSLTGLYMRNHDILGRAPAEVPNDTNIRLAQQHLGIPQETPATLGSPAGQSATILFGNPFSGCVAKAGQLRSDQLEQHLSGLNTRWKEFISKRRGKISQQQLIVLFQTFYCTAIPLSDEEVKMIGADKDFARTHPHPVVSKLGRELDDTQLTWEIARDVLGPQ